MQLPRFETLIDEHHDAIHRYLWRGLWSGGHPHPEDDAEDLTQETFLKAFNAYDNLRHASNLRAWLYKIATNCLRTHWRRNGRAPLPLEPELAGEPDRDPRPVEGAVDERQLQTLRRGLRRLPEKQRHAVILRYLDELEYDHIAQILDCSNDSARANVSHGLRQLRAFILPASTGSQEEKR